ncbi:MAG: metal-dependent transcriptional regulator [Rhodothermia bacterium]|nr:metal-dependent transcriptional regulator [Rhodothermia bacterium]
MLSQAVEDYLKIIYKLQGDGVASTSDIARALDVSPASVTSMTRRLSDLGLARYESYRGVTLTESGTKIALEIIRHHRLLETYLKEVLGYPWDKMHEEAEHLEHHISEAFEDKIEELLGYPTHDPHGDPIPTRDGKIAEPALDRLADSPNGAEVKIERVSDEDSEVLHYLEDLGLLPGAIVRIVGKEPFDGPLTLRIDGDEKIVGRAVARQVFVAGMDRPESDGNPTSGS